MHERDARAATDWLHARQGEAAEARGEAARARSDAQYERERAEGAQAQLADHRRHLESLTQSNAKYQARGPVVVADTPVSLLRVMRTLCQHDGFWWRLLSACLGFTPFTPVPAALQATKLAAPVAKSRDMICFNLCC